MARVVLENITKHFGAVVAVQDLSLEIADGEFFSLLGPSGCGKTTTLRMLAGFEFPSAGRIRFGEREVTHLPPNRRDTGMVFQNYALFPHLNVFENVAFGLKARGANRSDLARRVAEALALVNLSGFERRPVTQLSGGQQQRVALARAIVVEPDLLLLDEPLSNLDAKLRVETRAQIRRVQRELGMTTVYVTHDQEEALTLSDRLAVLKDGVCQQVGTPDEVYHTPANAFVAQFIGRANLLHGTITRLGPNGARVRTEQGLELTFASPDGLQEGQAITLTVRPEALRLLVGSQVRGEAEGRSGSADSVLWGTVTRRQFNGPTVEYTVQVGEAALDVMALSTGASPARVGEVVGLAIPPEQVRVLS